MDGCGWHVHGVRSCGGHSWAAAAGLCMTAGAYVHCDGDMGIGYGLVRKSVGRWKAIVYTFSPPTIQSSHVAIAMYLTLCAMLLRCSAMCLLGGGCDVRWIASGMCDPVLISTSSIVPPGNVPELRPKSGYGALETGAPRATIQVCAKIFL